MLLLGLHYVLEGSNNGSRYIARRVAKAVCRRLETEGECAEEPPVSSEIREARRLFRSGGLDVEVLSDAISEGRRDFAIEGLSLFDCGAYELGVYTAP